MACIGPSLSHSSSHSHRRQRLPTDLRHLFGFSHRGHTHPRDVSKRSGTRRTKRTIHGDTPSASESELDLEDDSYFNPTSSFVTILSDPITRERWEPFRSISWEEQEWRLSELQCARGRLQRQRKELTPMGAFRRIERRIRYALRHSSDLIFIEMVEEVIQQHLGLEQIEKNPEEEDKNPEEQEEEQEEEQATLSMEELADALNGEGEERVRATLILPGRDSFHRLLAHGVCQYYGLEAESIDTDTGERVVLVCVSHPVDLPPPIPLSTYLTHYHNKIREPQTNCDGPPRKRKTHVGKRKKSWIRKQKELEEALFPSWPPIEERTRRHGIV